MDDAVPYADLQTDTAGLQFPDYRSVDLIVAVRPPNPRMYRTAPPPSLSTHGWQVFQPSWSTNCLPRA